MPVNGLLDETPLSGYNPLHCAVTLLCYAIPSQRVHTTELQVDSPLMQWAILKEQHFQLVSSSAPMAFKWKKCYELQSVSIKKWHAPECVMSIPKTCQFLYTFNFPFFEWTHALFACFYSWFNGCLCFWWTNTFGKVTVALTPGCPLLGWIDMIWWASNLSTLIAPVNSLGLFFLFIAFEVPMWYPCQFISYIWVDVTSITSADNLFSSTSLLMSILLASFVCTTVFSIRVSDIQWFIHTESVFTCSTLTCHWRVKLMLFNMASSLAFPRRGPLYFHLDVTATNLLHHPYSNLLPPTLSSLTLLPHIPHH